MMWIKTKPPESEPNLKATLDRLYALYPPEYQEEVPAVTPPGGVADSVVASHSLLPEVLEPMFTALARLLSPELALTRRQQEMITTLVSSLNRCHY